MKVGIMMEIFVGLFVGLIGMVFLLIGIIMKLVRVNNIKRCTEVTNGTVIRVVKRHSKLNNFGENRYRVLYYPVFSYYANGYNIEVEDTVGKNPASFSEGQNVEIHYDPNNIRKFYVGNNTVINTLSIVFIAIGVVVILSCLVFSVIIGV